MGSKELETVSTDHIAEALERAILDKVREGLPAVVHRAVTSAIVEASQTPEEASAAPVTREVRRPSNGGRCAKVWDTLDKLSDEGHTPTLQEIKRLARRRKWNENNTRIEYYRWRGARGIHGRMAAA
jgi:hypothetical protein